jgi:hypothetical protein
MKTPMGTLPVIFVKRPLNIIVDVIVIKKRPKK